VSPSDPSANPVVYAEYESRLTAHLRRFYGKCLGLDESRVRTSIARRLARERGAGLARILDDLVGLAGTRMLDVGSGWGELLLECIERGAVGFGVELDAEEVAISELLLKSHGVEPLIVQGRGESLPWPDESFDLVTCQQVLEHVDDIDRVVSDMIRVARPGGALFVSTPNYLFPYEGHYMLKWFPPAPQTTRREDPQGEGSRSDVPVGARELHHVSVDATALATSRAPSTKHHA
jgi:2-polyprenyl-3-methyl-5-hydroxy-6-metoxy-1,4-benzoquinol methylase